MRKSRLLWTLTIAVGLASPPSRGAWAQGRGAQAAPNTLEVPSDLTPLLVPAPSELYLVVPFYEQDRATLQGNYATGARGRGGFGGRGGRGALGRGGAAASEPEVEPVSLSADRIARLRRFEADWRTALGALDRSRLAAAGREDLDDLQARIAENVAALDREERAMAEVLPLAPFAPAIVELVEARIRIREMDARGAAATVTEVTDGIGEIRARLEAGLANPGAPDAVTASPELARLAAATVEGLGRDLEEWYGFYFGYDPLFTWWVELPYAQVDSALSSYAGLLRGEVAAAGLRTSGLEPRPLLIEPAPPPPFAEVPDLAELTALPHDEMTQIVRRFRSAGMGSGSGGRGGGRGGPAPVEPGAEHYRDWLAALETLDFDGLSRNAQVDYLYIRRKAELEVERDGVALPSDPPRKTDDSGIPGDARGREGLIRDLEDEFISYTPEELIAIGEREFAWTEAEMIRASQEVGYGDDWKAAMDEVKTMYPPPGGQPVVIRDLLFEAIDYLRENDLLTVPQIAAESLHMGMMSPERQLVNPFFLGGAQITVSYPTNTMDYEARIQSMRGNNTPFSHATAYHEMIPGHNLTGYLGSRYAAYRAGLDATPFYGEGWALYWELTMYARGFNDTPEERIGALFWRMHRCARIIFSLKFHMGEWSPQEAVDFLVDRVNFEPNNARAEVLRSFQGGYSPLYQAAYLLGGLQLRGLHEELVGSGKMTDREFHDEVLRQGSMPIELIRLSVGDQELTRDTSMDWDFYKERGAM